VRKLILVVIDGLTPSMLEGAIRGIEENWFQGELAESAYRLERKFNEGRRIIVGVNRFTEGNDEQLDDLLEITTEDEERQIKRLSAVKDSRDETAVREALDRLAAEAAQPEVNLMPTIIDAVKTYATLGEIMSTLADVFGRHIEVPSI
jgi:methylmalonyl-CoA mutase N-terminal domain/subunit